MHFSLIYTSRALQVVELTYVRAITNSPLEYVYLYVKRHLYCSIFTSLGSLNLNNSKFGCVYSVTDMYKLDSLIFKFTTLHHNFDVKIVQFSYVF